MDCQDFGHSDVILQEWKALQGRKVESSWRGLSVIVGEVQEVVSSSQVDIFPSGYRVELYGKKGDTYYLDSNQINSVNLLI